MTTRSALLSASPVPHPPKPTTATLTALGLAEFLGISRATVWRLLASGKLPAPIRLGRAVRWDRWTVEEWLSAGAPAREAWERMQQASQ